LIKLLLFSSLPCWHARIWTGGEQRSQKSWALLTWLRAMRATRDLLHCSGNVPRTSWKSFQSGSEHCFGLRSSEMETRLVSELISEKRSAFHRRISSLKALLETVNQSETRPATQKMIDWGSWFWIWSWDGGRVQITFQRAFSWIGRIWPWRGWPHKGMHWRRSGEKQDGNPWQYWCELMETQGTDQSGGGQQDAGLYGAGQHH